MREIKDLYLENYEILKKELRKMQISGSIYNTFMDRKNYHH